MKESLNPFSDIHKRYVVRMEIAMIISLLSFILIFRLDIKPAPVDSGTMNQTQEIVFMEEIQQTRQQDRTPPPPRPASPNWS